MNNGDNPTQTFHKPDAGEADFYVPPGFANRHYGLLTRPEHRSV